MITKYQYDGETWIDIDHGTPEEIRQVMDTYKIHPFVARELTSTTRKPRAEFHDDYIYCILHFPAFKHTHAEEPNQEVDFIIGKKILITARYDTVDAMHKYGKSLEVKEVLDRDKGAQGALANTDANTYALGNPKAYTEESTHTIFTGLLRELYTGLFDELAYIEDMTEEITKQIFLGREKDMVISISNVTRTLLDFKKVTDLHRDVLEELLHKGGEVFSKKFAKEIEIIMLDYLKIHSTIISNMEMLRDLRETNNSLLTTKQNEIMKQLTVLGAVILPLSIITQLFAMDVSDSPLATHPFGFWIIVGMMMTVALITLTYAHNRKWL